MKMDLQEKGRKNKIIKLALVPTEGKYFEVYPAAINEKLFEEERKDPDQEWTRIIINEALRELKKNNSKYSKRFKTYIPEKTWSSKNIEECEKFAEAKGGHIADWIEQALEWAQRITNGETWKAVCNDSDTTDYDRIIIWKNGHIRTVGGSLKAKKICAASNVDNNNYQYDTVVNNTVPLIVIYD